MLRALHLIDLPYEGIWLDQLELVPFVVPLFDSGTFLARPFASISCFFTVDGVLVGLVVICIVFSFARTLTAITVTTSLLFATGCVSFRTGQSQCLQLASNCIHNSLCVSTYTVILMRFCDTDSCSGR